MTYFCEFFYSVVVNGLHGVILLILLDFVLFKVLNLSLGANNEVLSVCNLNNSLGPFVKLSPCSCS
jgi:hypothetical protein